jgi:Uri superfamily endonuclease
MAITAWEAQASRNAALVTYQLDIELPRAATIQVGRLGRLRFPAGRYRYTGSARRNLIARVRRHLSNEKNLRWHIDYLLAARGARIVAVNLSADPECACNQQVAGRILVPGFGASDCRARCGSHLKYLGEGRES